MKFKISGLMALAGFLFAGTAQAEIIDFTPPLTSTGTVGTLATATSQSFGQTFEVGATDTFLDSFTLFSDFHSGTTSSKFRAYVMKWGGATANTLGSATGPVLFESDDLIDAMPGSFPGLPLTERTFSPGISLDADSAYIIFFNSSLSVGEFGFDSGSTEIGYTGFNSYSDGRIMHLANGGDFGKVTTDTWATLPGSIGFNDLSFKVVLTSASAVPVPASLPLFASGILWIGTMLRRRTLPH